MRDIEKDKETLKGLMEIGQVTELEEMAVYWINRCEIMAEKAAESFEAAVEYGRKAEELQAELESTYKNMRRVNALLDTREKQWADTERRVEELQKENERLKGICS